MTQVRYITPKWSRNNKPKEKKALGDQSSFELMFGWDGVMDHLKPKALKVDNGIGSKLNGARI